MGSLAGHLSEHNKIAVFNRTKPNLKFGLLNIRVKFGSPAELAKISDVIILCVGDDNDVKDIVTGHQGLLNNLKPNL